MGEGRGNNNELINEVGIELLGQLKIYYRLIVDIIDSGGFPDFDTLVPFGQECLFVQKA